MMYSNNTLNFQESMTILNAHMKKSLETYCMHLLYVALYLTPKQGSNKFPVYNLLKGKE